ncbi:MAG: hypothetical protein MPL62_16065 [Alphaproteobacteria bacterium]|nr:hypothetical protein [Alphaproteobacteria bacterium]
MSKKDRDQHFKKEWSSVIIKLPNDVEAEVDLSKRDAFWDDCPELWHLAIKAWLAKNGYAGWEEGCPPPFVLTPLGGNRFHLEGPA